MVCIFRHSDWTRRDTRICRYSVRMREKMDKKNSQYGQFSRSAFVIESIFSNALRAMHSSTMVASLRNSQWFSEQLLFGTSNRFYKPLSCLLQYVNYLRNLVNSLSFNFYGASISYGINETGNSCKLSPKYAKHENQFKQLFLIVIL